MGSQEPDGITILSPDWATWKPDCPEMENDLLTFENSTLDGFTFFLNYTIVDVYHKLLGRYIHVRERKGRYVPSLAGLILTALSFTSSSDTRGTLPNN